MMIHHLYVGKLSLSTLPVSQLTPKDTLFVFITCLLCIFSFGAMWLYSSPFFKLLKSRRSPAVELLKDITRVVLYCLVLFLSEIFKWRCNEAADHTKAADPLLYKTWVNFFWVCWSEMFHYLCPLPTCKAFIGFFERFFEIYCVLI